MRSSSLWIRFIIRHTVLSCCLLPHCVRNRFSETCSTYRVIYLLHKHLTFFSSVRVKLRIRALLQFLLAITLASLLWYPVGAVWVFSTDDCVRWLYCVRSFFTERKRTKLVQIDHNNSGYLVCWNFIWCCLLLLHCGKIGVCSATRS